MDTCEIAIVGAGIAGAALAYRLAGSRSVVLLEAEAQPGYHTTGRSAAMFMESYGPPAVRALTRASRAFYEQPPAGFADVPLLTPRGALYVASAVQLADLDAMEAGVLSGGQRLERLDAQGALAIVPVLRPAVAHAALYDRDAADIDVHALLQGFLRGARRQGCALRTGARLVRAARVADAWELHFAAGEPLRARSVVNAAGAWADAVGAQFGAAPIGLEPRRRSAFTFAAPEGVDISSWPTVGGIDETWYFKPDAGRLLASPANADPTVPHDVLPEELDIATAIDRIQAATTLTIRRPASTWAGLRSFVRDGELVIGWDEGCPGLFWLAGQGGYGIQTAAGASELAAALLRGDEVSADLAHHGVNPMALAPLRLR